MEREMDPARTLQRIATELGVSMSSFYDRDGTTSSDDEAMQRAIAALLSAFAVAVDPEERRRCVTLLRAEARRLCDLPERDDG